MSNDSPSGDGGRDPLPAWRAVLAFAIVALPACAALTYVMTARALRVGAPATSRAPAADTAARRPSPNSHGAAAQDLAALRDANAALTAQMEKLRSQIADLEAGVVPDSRPLLLSQAITIPLGGALCTVLFERPAEQAPYLDVFLDVTNTSDAPLPGTVRVAAYDGFCVQLGETYLNLFGEGAERRLAPGERRTARGSMRIPATIPLPERVIVRFAD